MARRAEARSEHGPDPRALALCDKASRFLPGSKRLGARPGLAGSLLATWLNESALALEGVSEMQGVGQGGRLSEVEAAAQC